MTDQPKPNQPSSTTPPAAAQPSPKDSSSAADKAPASSAASPEPKPTQPAAEVKPDSTPKPAADVKPDSKPEEASTSEPKVEAKPAASSTPSQPAQPPTPAAPVPPKREPIEDDSSTVISKPNAPTSPAPSAAPTLPTAASNPPARDISEDPTLPGKPNAVSPIAKPSTTTTVQVPPPADLTPRGDKEDTILPLTNSSKVTQRFTDPTASGQPSTGTICPSCGHRNRPGTLICDNCGTNLIGGVKSAVGTRDLVNATEAAAAASASLLDATQREAIESAGGSTFTEDMVLRIEIEGGATPMLVYPKQEIILGRRDPNTGTLPDVDMTAYSGYRMGVSRTHASIRLQDKQLNLSDRGSSNGTFLNGTRLVAHRPYPLRDGDEIRLGQMVLKIFFQSNKPRT